MIFFRFKIRQLNFFSFMPAIEGGRTGIVREPIRPCRRLLFRSLFLQLTLNQLLIKIACRNNLNTTVNRFV